MIVEEFIKFDSEITLSYRRDVRRRHLLPAGRAPTGGGRLSRKLAAGRDSARGASVLARFQARKVVDALGGHGIFGVEFFVCGDQAIFSELSPRPHDTGMVTLISQLPNEFELHLRAILDLPIPGIEVAGPSASAVILADRECEDFEFKGVFRGACGWRPRLSGRRQDLRQAENAEEPAHGRGSRARSRALRMRSRAPRAPRRA